jgi:hypothetical protein
MLTANAHLTMARRLVLLTLLLVTASACSVKFVADYDAATFDEILKTGKLVDRFYGDMLEAPEAQRKYATYSARYVEVETDIRSLLTRNKTRPLNTESIKINETILNLWMKYKDNHQKNDTYRTSIARLDRGRFLRLFAAAADAEAAKRLDSDDKNSNKDSK